MTNADALLAKVRRKYKEYGIQEKPFVIVKADAGPSGSAVMTVRDAKELADLGEPHARPARSDSRRRPSRCAR